MTNATSRRVSEELNRLVHVRTLIASKHADGRGLAAKAKRQGLTRVANQIERIYKSGDDTHKGVPKQDLLVETAAFLGFTSQQLGWAFSLDLYPDVIDEVTRDTVARMCRMSDKERQRVNEFTREIENST